MKITYKLNGKNITESEFLNAFQGMTKYIENAILDAIDSEEPIPVFHTPKGPLVISVDSR